MRQNGQIQWIIQSNGADAVRKKIFQVKQTSEETMEMTGIRHQADVIDIVITIEVEEKEALNLEVLVDNDDGEADQGVKVDDEVVIIDIKVVIITGKSAIAFVPDQDLFIIKEGK